MLIIVNKEKVNTNARKTSKEEYKEAKLNLKELINLEKALKQF